MRPEADALAIAQKNPPMLAPGHHPQDCLTTHNGHLFIEECDTVGLVERFGSPIFVFSDTLLALVLLAGAILLVLEERLGESLALVAGGMLVFLGTLDAAYFWRTGMFAPEHEGYMNLAIVVAALAGGIFLIFCYA
jgi:hypothetical protein